MRAGSSSRRRAPLAAVLAATALAAGVLPATTTTAVAAASTSPCATFQSIAHRGLHPEGVDENTLEAFDRASAASYPIETDVWPDADGKLWVFHDRDPFRATGVHARMDQLSSAQVAELRYTEAGSAILPFDDLVPWLGAHPRTQAYIEPKKRLLRTSDGELINVPETIAATLTEAGVAEQSWLTHYNTPQQAPLLRTDYPQVHLLLKAGRTTPDPASLAVDGYDTVGLVAGRITPGVVDAHHDAGIAVQAQNVNRSPAWRRTIRAGADGLLTNAPEAVTALCRAVFRAPVIRRLPSHAAAGRWVSILGKNFRYLQQVRFGHRAATYHVRSPRRIMVRVPRGRLPRLSRVRVTNDYGTAVSARRFRRTV